jgi:tetratricopeptide (TPR) repeat protein
VTELLKAIASLWPLVGMVVLGFAVFHPKSQIRSLNVLKFKKGDTELEIQKQAQVQEIGAKSEATAAAELDVEEKTDSSRQIAGPSMLEPSELFWKMVDEFFKKEIKEAEETFRILSEAEPNAVTRLRHEATYYALRYLQAGDPGALSSLESRKNNDETRAHVYWWIGRCYEDSNRLDDAIAAYEQAVSWPCSDEELSRYTARLAACLLRIGKPEAAIRRLGLAVRTATPGEPQAILYEQIAEIEKEQGNKLNAALAFEMVSFSRPADTTARFNAAYAADEANLVHLACANYSTVLKFNPENRGALNNQGVALGKLRLPIHSNAAYQEAAKRDNSLAMANLAFNLLAAGFAKEAEDMVELALKQENPHESVGRAMAKLSESRKDEEQELQKILVRGAKQQRFFQLFYPIYVSSEPIDSLPAGKWFIGQTVVDLTIGADGLVVDWGTGASRRRVEGALKNRAGIVKIRQGENTSVTSYVYFDVSIDHLIILSPEMEEGLYIEVVRKED